MKYKLIAFILILATTTWAQTSTPAQPAPSDKASNTMCACCNKAASDSTSASTGHEHACMHAKSSSKDSKEMASCCNGKDGKSCARMEASAGCCGEKCSAAAGAKDCCTEKNCCADQNVKKTAHNCCGDSQCMHGQTPTPGN